MTPRLAFAIALLIPGIAAAQHDIHASGIGHSAMMSGGIGTPAGNQPQEPGQSAFAAIQEIVELLEADPATDWSRVDIEALRRHLVDMSNVTLGAAVRSAPVEGGVRFYVSGSGAVRDSIKRMVAAHVATMNGVGGWSLAAEERDDGAALTATVAEPGDLARLRALGFIGIMTRGSHHQTHHLAIAAGNAPHR